MIIDKSLILEKDNYLNIENVKKQIIIGNTLNHDMKHIIGWLHRNNGKYKKTAPYSISKGGVIYEHFNPSYQSSYFDDDNLNNKSIVILLENDGWLIKNGEENNFISWLGYIYNKKDVIDKKWRGNNHWVKYNKKQIDSLIFLVKKLCEEFTIPLNVITHNTKVDDLDNYTGIMYKSNLNTSYTDVTPAFYFDYFTNNINLK